jgi:putative chitinase
MIITLDQLIQIMPYARQRAGFFLDGINDTLVEAEINNKVRVAAFLSQVGHESGQLRYVEELASGNAYEGRKDLGNTQPGDGRKFKGRGLLQVTGRANYALCGAALGLDLLNHPDLLKEPTNAVRSAGWFWSTHGLNLIADSGDQKRVTKRINGGYNGLDDRLALFAQAMKVL